MRNLNQERKVSPFVAPQFIFRNSVKMSIVAYINSVDMVNLRRVSILIIGAFSRIVAL